MQSAPEGDATKWQQPAVPHYMLPNFASILPEYANSEADKIRESFSTGNYSAISKIPNSICPDNVNSARYQSIDQNRKSSALNQAGKKAATSYTRNLFQEFEYVPSRYSLADELRSKSRVEKERKRLDIGGKDFVCSSNAVKLKHEDGFEDKSQKFPYMSEPFEGAQEQMMRAKWLEDSKVLHGAFVPSGMGHTLEKPTRTTLPQMVQEIHRVVSEDWSDYRFSVLATEEDTIVIRFDLKTIESEKGLVAYMNVMARSNMVVQKYCLKKVVEDWNTQPGDGYLHFMFQPPWVHTRAVNTYFTLHPETRQFKPV